MSGQVRQRWGLEPLTLMGRGLNCLEGERQREGAIWCLEVEDSVCLVSGKWGGGRMKGKGSGGGGSDWALALVSKIINTNCD